MILEFDKDKKIFIIEGIAGSGKNTLQEELKRQLKDRVIYEFFEEELLFSWKHAWIEGIDEMRLQFCEKFLGYCSDILKNNENAIFILNRFHISYKIFSLLETEEANQKYNTILEKLGKLGTVVFICTIPEEIIEQRSSHSERTDPTWQIHLQKRLAQRGCTTLSEMYNQEQKKIITLAEQQNLPYQIINMTNLHF